jgi:hypothetical protein
LHRATTARIAPLVLPPPAQIRAGLDAFLASATMSIQTSAGSVSVPIGFRMVQHQGDVYPRAREQATLEAALRSAGLSRFEGLILIGRGEPGQIQTVVQKLVDMGELAHEAGADDAQKIRNMMFRFNVGLDCAGYVAQAFLSATGLTRQQAHFTVPADEKLPLWAYGYARVGLADVRPGDIFCLGAPSYDSVGHRAIVYDVRPATAQDLWHFNYAVARNRFDTHAQQEFPHPSGPVTVYEVDSSWGNGHDGTHGGVERALLMHDEGTGVWFTQKRDGSGLSTTPYDHPLEGVFRWVR